MSPIPAGYRQGLITAITVFIGFTLYFIRYWSFESIGDWTVGAVVVVLLTLISLGFQVFALARALRPEDEDLMEYNKTVRCFIGSILIIFISLAISIIISILAKE